MSVSACERQRRGCPRDMCPSACLLPVATTACPERSLARQDERRADPGTRVPDTHREEERAHAAARSLLAATLLQVRQPSLTPVMIPGDEEGLSDAVAHNGQLAEYAALRILLPCGIHAFWIGVVTQEHDQGSLRRLLHPPPKATKYRLLWRRLSGIADQQNSGTQVDPRAECSAR